MTELIAAIGVGAVIGALLGILNSNRPGGSHSPTLPRRGALWGAGVGLIWALAAPLGLLAEKNTEAPQEPAASESATSAMIEIRNLPAFKEGVLQQPGKTLVDFYATWCGPCKVYHPILERLASQGLPGVSFAMVDVDKAKDIAKAYRVQAIPTTIIFENGKEVKRFLGVQTEEDLKAALTGGT